MGCKQICSGNVLGSVRVCWPLWGQRRARLGSAKVGRRSARRAASSESDAAGGKAQIGHKVRCCNSQLKELPQCELAKARKLPQSFMALGHRTNVACLPSRSGSSSLPLILFVFAFAFARLLPPFSLCPLTLLFTMHFNSRWLCLSLSVPSPGRVSHQSKNRTNCAHRRRLQSTELPLILFPKSTTASALLLTLITFHGLHLHHHYHHLHLKSADLVDSTHSSCYSQP